MPDEPTHPAAAPLILDYRGPDQTSDSGRPPFENRPARTAGVLAIISIAIIALVSFVMYLEGDHSGPMSPFVIVCFLLGIPSFMVTGTAAFVFGIVGLSRLRRPNTREILPSILGIVAGLLVFALCGLLGFLASRG